MKIKQLKIHNIASIADTSIDFEHGALGAADIFLITGKTGAGKSTILDAICLALFNTAPRFESTQMQGKVELDTMPKGITLSDPRNLLRRNTAEGSVELTFEGNNGKTYISTWETHRSRKKIDGNLSNVKRSLQCGDTFYTGSELKEELATAVGMSFDQFCRTTMLAQGEFTRFLNSKDDDKGQILEKILNVDVYATISRKIYEKCNSEDSKLRELKAKSNGFNPLSENELNIISEQIRTLENEINKIARETGEENRRLEWLKTSATLLHRQQAAKEKMEACLAASETEEARAAKEKIAQLSATAEIRLLIEKRHRLKKERKLLSGRKRKMERYYPTLLRSLEKLRKQIAETENIIKEEERTIEGLADRRPTIESADVIISKLQFRKNLINLREHNNARKATLAEKLPELENALTKCRDAVKKEREALIFLLNKIDVKTDSLEQAGLPRMYAARDAFKDRQSALAVLRTQIEKLTIEKTEISQLQSQQSQTAATLPCIEKKIEELKKKSEVKSLLIENLRTSLGKAEESLSDWCRRLRSELQPGDVCPVCRSKITDAFESDEAIEISLNPLRDQLNSEIEAEKELTKALNEACVELRTARQLSDIYSRQIAEKQERIKRDGEIILQSCSKLNINQDEAGKAYDECSSELARLQPFIESAEILRNKIEILRKEAENQRTKKETVEAGEKKAVEALQDCEASIASLNVLLESENKQINECESEIEGLAKGRWQFNWSTDTAEFISELKEAEKLLKNALENINKISNQRENAMKEIAVCEAAEERVELRGGSLEGSGGSIEFGEGELGREFTEFATRFEEVKASEDGMRAESNALLFQLKDKIEPQSLNMTYFRLLRTLSEMNESDVEALRKYCETLRTAVATAETMVKSIKSEIEAHNEAKPSINEEDTAESIQMRIDEHAKRLADFQVRTGEYNGKLEADRKMRQELSEVLKEIDAQKAIADKWDELCKLFGSADGKKFRTIALSFVLGHLLEKANWYLRQLMPRYRLSRRGDNFLIMIEDAYQNGARRAANLLSGGESFVVSLALALALADIGSQFKVDILFIDEGFGSLSGDALEGAISTLRSLHRQGGRRVGIISHVAELRDRIPVKINVEREGSGAASVVVSGE